MFTIDFEPIGRRGEFSSEMSLLDCARELSVDLVSICGGGGSCERCKVQVIAGEVSPLTAEEEFSLTTNEIERGYRFACMATPLGDVKLHVPQESFTALQRTQVEGLEVDVPPEPMIRSVIVELPKPSLDHPLADTENLWQALTAQGIEKGTIDFRVQQTLPLALREHGRQLKVGLRGREIIALGPIATNWLGMAVDIGTTKIAGYLIDLETGKTLASKGKMNPQIPYGEDVISRIVAANDSAEDAAKLQHLLSEALSQIAAELCKEIGATTSDIVELVAVGNTAIHHLFLGLPARQLGISPYVPVLDSSIDLKARDLGIEIAPGGYLHLLPNIAGYVGADHVAMLLATRIDKAEDTVLAIDIGTNTEICLTHQGKMTSVSCASGPAFEGAHIKFGMRAAPGAIEHVRWADDRLEIQTIGGEAPVGICGSGLLDIVAELRLQEIVGKNGKMADHARVQNQGANIEFVLAERSNLDPITITQKDVRELQLAKAAIRLGIVALVEAAELTEAEIDRVIIAGAFGSFIDVASAITIGMLPELPLDRFEQVGNAAGTGARLALVSKSERERAEKIAAADGYIELARMPGFTEKFAMATYL